jgi:hypothetical protein
MHLSVKFRAVGHCSQASGECRVISIDRSLVLALSKAEGGGKKTGQKNWNEEYFKATCGRSEPAKNTLHSQFPCPTFFCQMDLQHGLTQL